MGVPRDAQITKTVLQDVRMCPQKPKKLLKFASNQASKPVNQQISRWGPAAGAKPVDTPRQALACRRRREEVSAQGPNLSPVSYTHLTLPTKA